MGYGQRSDSSGAMVALVVAALLVVILGILAVGGASLFWVRASSLQAQAVATQQQVVTGQQVVTSQRRGEAKVRLQQQYTAAATPDPRLDFAVRIDREGNTHVDGEKIGLAELRTQLARLKEETSNAFSVQINADSECPVKHLIPLLSVCDQIGDLDFRIVSSDRSDSSPGTSSAEN